MTNLINAGTKMLAAKQMCRSNGFFVATRVAIAVTILATFLSQQTGATEAQRSNAAIRLEKLDKQFFADTESWNKKMGAAKTDKERAPLWDTYPPIAYASKYRELVRKYPSDPSTAKSATWLAQFGRDKNDRPEAIRILLKYHLKSSEIEPLISMLSYDSSSEATQLLRAYISSRKDPQKVLEAKLALARKLTGTDNAEAAKLLKEIELRGKNFQEYKNSTRTLAEAATAALFEMNFLAVGKKAPDILGLDVEGKKFKLSDYAGKVIMLDFFGFW